MLLLSASVLQSYEGFVISFFLINLSIFQVQIMVFN